MKQKISNWEKEIIKEMEFWFSPSGKELTLSMIEQGYESYIGAILISLTANSWGVVGYIKELKEKYIIK